LQYWCYLLISFHSVKRSASSSSSYLFLYLLCCSSLLKKSLHIVGSRFPHAKQGISQTEGNECFDCNPWCCTDS
jgi:hypothetical protein